MYNFPEQYHPMFQQTLKHLSKISRILRIRTSSSWIKFMPNYCYCPLLLNRLRIMYSNWA